MSWKPAKKPSRFPDWVPERVRGPIRWCVKWSLVSFTLLVAVSLFYFYLSWQYDLGIVGRMPERSVILDRHGEEFATVHGERRRLIERAEIPEVMVQAVLAREDARFREHMGVDLRGLVRATLRNVKDRSFTQGASTLTMQLTRNSYELRAKSIHRKLLEIAVTLRIEHRYSKDEILTHYLNRIYFGAGCHGVEEAAQTYFGRSAKELNTGECAMLVGIIRGPHLFSPFRNVEGALAQRDEVLVRMVQCDYLTENQLVEAKREPIRLVSEEERHKGSSYARESIRKRLNVILDEHDIRDGGLRIFTTLDTRMQRRVEAAMTAAIDPVEGDVRSGLQAAAIRIEPQSGAIRALCGGRDYAESPYNRVYRIRRDLGPMFTPFLQAVALERSKVVIPGQPVQIGRQLGVEETIRLSKRLGFSGPFAEGEDLYRGFVAVSPMELAGAVSALMAKGKRHEAYLIEKITDVEGRVLYQRSPSVSQALSEAVADDALAELGNMTGGSGVLATSTGSRRDAWAISMDGDHATVLWLGHDDPKKIAGKKVVNESLLSTMKRME